MKKTIITAFISSCICFSNVSYGVEKQGEMINFTQAAGLYSYELKNGFKVIFVPYQNASTTTVMLTVRTGSKNEGYGETGMAHLLEHMLFKSTPTKKDIKTFLTEVGAKWNGTTTQDRTNYFETFDASQITLGKVLEMEADRLANATFTKNDLDTEMTVVRNELERNANNPSTVLMESLEHAAWHWHGYGRTTIGEKSDLEGAPFSDLRSFYKKHYRPDNSFLVVSGKFDEKETIRKIDKYFGKLKNPKSLKIQTWTKEPAQYGEKLTVERRPSGETIAMTAWKTPPASSNEFVALDLGLSAIFAVPTGPLYQEFVLNNKKAISSSGGSWGQSEGGLALAIVSAEKGKDGYVLSNDLSTFIENLAAEGISEKNLERAKDEQRNAYRKFTLDAPTMASLVSSNEILGDWRLYMSQNDRMEKTTIVDVNSALKKWLIRSNRTSGILIPEETGQGPIVPPIDIKELKSEVTSGHWKDVSPKSDPNISDISVLAKKMVRIQQNNFDIALMPRKTKGDRVWISFSRGWGNEKAVEGMATSCSAASALMIKGGAGMTDSEIKDFMEKNGATFALNMKGFSFEVEKKNLISVFNKSLELFKTPSFPENEFDRTKQELFIAIETMKTDPGSVGNNALGLAMNMYPKGHFLYARTFDEFKEDITTLKKKDVEDCFSKFSGFQNVKIGITGDLSKDEVVSLVKNIPEWKSTVPYSRLHPLFNPKNGTVIKNVVKDKPNTVIVGSLQIPLKDDHKDTAALRLALNVLGGDANSRIWKRLRENEGLSYTATSSFSPNSYDELSTVSFYVIANNANSDKAFKFLNEEIDNVLIKGITKEELDRVKKSFFDARKMSFSEESSYASFMSDALDSGRDFDFIAKYDERIKNVSLDDANQALKKWLQKERIFWSIAGGDK